MSKRDEALFVAIRSQQSAAYAAVRGVKTPRHVAVDIVHEAVIATWRAARAGRVDVDDIPSVRGYLYVVGLRMARRWAWKHRYEVHVDGLALAGPDPMPRLEARDTLARIAELLDVDDARLLKAFGEGLSTAGAAPPDVPAGTTYTRLRAARIALREAVKRDAAAERVLLHKTPRKPRRK